MKKLNDAERKQLQRELIELWRAAGSLPLDDEMSKLFDPFYPYKIQSFGLVKQTYGNASKLKVWLEDQDITAHVAKLRSLRLCKDGTVNIRSGVSVRHDEAKLATAADRALLNATIGCLDLKAMAAMDSAFKEEFYNKYLVSKVTFLRRIDPPVQQEVEHE